MRALWVLLLCVSGCRAERASSLPPTMVWAWHRAEDLRFLDAERIGVAYLAATVLLRGDAVVVHRRRGALQVPLGIALEPVVRVEIVGAEAPKLDDKQRGALLRALMTEAEGGGTQRLQIDFEVLTSQRPFYRALLTELRAALGHRYTISITALGSWCLADHWIDELPVDEVVPMFTDSARTRTHYAPASRPAMTWLRCVGVRSRHDHRRAGLQDAHLPRRTYLFSATPWRAASLERHRAALALRERRP